MKPDETVSAGCGCFFILLWLLGCVVIIGGIWKAIKWVIA